LIPRDINGRLFSWDVALVLNSYIIKNNFNSEFFITLEEGKNLGWKLKNNMEQEGVQVNINNNLNSIIYYHLELCFEMNDLSKKKTPLNVVNELKLDKITEYIDGSFKEKINNCYRDLTTFNGHPVFIETNKILNRDEDPSGVSAWTIRSTTKEMFKNSSVYIENNTELNNIIFANIDKGNYHFVVNYPILWYSSIEYYLAIIAHEIGHVLSRILNYRFNSTVIEELTVDLFSNRICMDYGLYFTHEMYSIIYDCWLVKYKELSDEDLETAITFSNLLYDEFKKRLIIKDEDEIPGEILKLF
jgi:hypothetical protein